jgi:predicted PurR-regulated permease PerM
VGERTPLRPAVRARLAAAFHECGSGLLVGLTLTALLQGAVGTLVYLALRVPHALVLGGLTCLGALVPLVGTASVWGPVALGLFLGGRRGAALALVALGLLLIGTVDNLMRPYFARFGRLDLPTWIVALSMFGGLRLLGFQGLVLGPVVVRLTLELLALAREAEEPP